MKKYNKRDFLMNEIKIKAFKSIVVDIYWKLDVILKENPIDENKVIKLKDELEIYTKIEP